MNMAFVNEYIKKSDIEKYKIKEIDQQVGIHWRTNSDSWTVDPERGIYLRLVQRGREEFSYQSGWTFYWHGNLIWIELEMVEGSSARNAPGWARKRVTKLCLMGEKSNQLPPELAEERAQILSDLKEALLAYRDGGVYSATTSYELFLDVAEGV